MFFNIFKKKQNQNNNILASITYLIKKNEKSPILNIEIDNYDEISIESLCYLLDTLGSDACYVETIEMIKDIFIENHQENLLIKILTHVSNSTKSKIVKTYEEKIENEPCIKPSEMLKQTP